jgi:hypothetical protein
MSVNLETLYAVRDALQGIHSPKYEGIEMSG